ncbi:MAG: methylmalonyl Co-A mutase-associated GTPase MeaB [Hyphomicrobiaceae bacterium]|nr:methylmalonyl Co-A mutase-associated GTPase MeaB [Hyphomicrobiaceae bacterium]
MTHPAHDQRPSAAPAQPAVADYIAGIVAGDRAWLGRAITLVESTRADHQALAAEVLAASLPHATRRDPALRLGITGVPGVGKSTTIDQLGMNLVAGGHRVAVLAVDPTSRRTGGSILGDKTRMNRLSQSPAAFIRPSPTSGTLGGVTRKTRETMVLVEAAGFDVVIVETVGVGQSETAVADMVDFFLVLLLAGGGDDLQGIKKGVIELADMIAINKADGDNKLRAERAAGDYRLALHIFTPADAPWQPPVLTMSGLENSGLDALWGKVTEHRAKMQASGDFTARRQRQAVSWMRDMLEDRMMATLSSRPDVAAELSRLEAEVRDGRTLATVAVDRLMAVMGF